MPAAAPAWQREIEDLHRVFEAWLGGSVPEDDASFAPIESALTPEFTFVDPHGRHCPRSEVVGKLRSAHGGRPGLVIRIEAPRLLHEEGKLTLASYEEHQEDHGGARAIVSTVLFRERADAPNGVEWLHVHETWKV
ncbi:MAG: DUF4440 domain-containing protein [Planctomycetota bacterium]|jgi:hypothetical protein